MGTRERKAAVCKQGHVGKCCMELNEKYTGDLKCGKCGNDFLINCLSCKSYIKGDPYYDDDPLFVLPFSPDDNCFNCGESYPWKNRFKFLKNIRFPNISSKIAKVGTIITIAASIVFILQVFFDFI